MAGDALELALALMRAPSMRGLLRQRPLPAGVDEVIELAAGLPVRAASGHTGETPERLREAARFYLREVLLFADADAYRVLGVAPDAPAARIKAHHRLMQRWLHPDRRAGDWESAFAARVNAAWAELRTPARRAAYDARLGRRPEAAAPVPRRILIPDAQQAEPAPSQDWRNRLWLAVAAAAGLWLVLLVVRQALAPAPEWEPAARSGDAAIERGGIAAAIQAAAERVKRTPWEDAEEGAPRRHAMPAPRVAAASPVEAVRAPSNRAQPAAALAPAPPPGPASLPAVEAQLAEAGSMPMDAEAGSLRSTPDDAVFVPVQVENVAAWNPSREMALDLPAPSPQAVEIAPAVAIDTTAMASTAPVPAAMPTLEQVRMAQRSGRQLIDYLGDASAAMPPIWQSVRTLEIAAGLRQWLSGDGGRFDAPDWQIEAERARMVVMLRPDAHRASAASLHAEFAWIDGHWLLDALRMDAPDAGGRP